MKIVEEMKFEDVIIKQIQNQIKYRADRRNERFHRYQTKAAQKAEEKKSSDADSTKEGAEEKDAIKVKVEEGVEPMDQSTEIKMEVVDIKQEKIDVKEEKPDHEKQEKVCVKEEKMDTETDEKNETNGSAAEASDKPKEEEEVLETPVVAPPTHLFRVGWSVVDTELQLGESINSFAYESSGKFVTGKAFVDYSIKFAVGDVVTAYVVSSLLQ